MFNGMRCRSIRSYSNFVNATNDERRKTLAGAISRRRRRNVYEYLFVEIYRLFSFDLFLVHDHRHWVYFDVPILPQGTHLPDLG